MTKALSAMTARKEEAERSTRHGMVFEDAVFDFVNRRRSEGDVVTPTGNVTGRLRNCKKGDCVIELGLSRPRPGPASSSRPSRTSPTRCQKALAEIAEARKNRDAGVGVFVFSRRTVPSGITEPLTRYGSDVVVVWDAENPASDAYLFAALSVAKALSVRAVAGGSAGGPDGEAVEKAIREIEGRPVAWMRSPRAPRRLTAT